MITQQRLKEVMHYDPESGILTRIEKRSGASCGMVSLAGDKDGYITVQIDRKQLKVHRLAFLYMTGLMPENVDHINRDTSDNRWFNLRAATKTQNGANSKTRKDNTSGYRGVCWQPSMHKWMARIWIDGKCKILGYYKNPADGFEVYKAKHIEIFGEFSIYRTGGDE